MLFIGDSSLARIPPHDYSSVQINSFPGTQILAKLNPCSWLEAERALEEMLFCSNLTEGG